MDNKTTPDTEKVSDAERKENRNSIIALALAFGGVACVVVGTIYTNQTLVSHIGLAVAFIGFVFGVVVEEKRMRRTENQSPPPQP